ncbi:uncharacterized protein LOC135124672 [Zophobas morio]|uniref:uncharacterized protein LOC135124672 n=1 Tax=Zophobas morio TaxID=2755281 RepID=UPI003083B99E
MKVTVILFVSLFVSLFAYIQCCDDESPVSDCMKKSGLTDDIWEDIEAGNFSIPNLGAYFLCTHQVMGFQTKSGLLRTTAIINYFREKGLSREMERDIKRRCFINQKTPEMTSIKFEKLIYHSLITPKILFKSAYHQTSSSSKMKFLAVLFVAFCVYSQCTGDIAHEQAVTACEQQSGVTPEILGDLKAHKYDNPKLAAYLLCVHKVVKFQNEAGELQGDNIKAKLKEKYDDALVQKVAEECFENHESPEKTAVEVRKCADKILRSKTN